tara:strand:+ start:106 stop:504 length:399 start_codon:yes stop_codon:yes gene_type:complete
MDEKINKQEDKKSLLKKITDAVPDREEQFELVGLGVRLFLLTWATLMLSLSYLDLSKLGIPQQKIDPTFIASVFVGLASSFGASITQKGKENGGKSAPNQGITAAEMKEILSSSQIVRIEHAPLKIITDKKD